VKTEKDHVCVEVLPRIMLGSVRAEDGDWFLQYARDLEL